MSRVVGRTVRHASGSNGGTAGPRRGVTGGEIDSRTSGTSIGVAPPGYGPPGLGNAVFSVSSFMDVLDPAIPVAAFPD